MQNLPYDAVLFDLDGTLTRSEDGILASLRYALTRMNLPIPSGDVLKQYIGPPLRSSFIGIAGLTSEQADEAVGHYVTHYDREGIFLYSVFPQIRTLLHLLKKNGAYVAVATSKPIARTVRLLELYHLARYFDCISGEEGNESQIGKARLIERALPARYGKAVMIGDRKFDVEGAKTNGIDSIGVRYGYAPDGELEAADPTYLIRSPLELLRFLCPDCAAPRGFFLSVEGMDGSGKTTQINKLVASLRSFGYDVVQTREPGGCPISEKIRNLVLSPENMEMSARCEALLYAASRAQHVHEVIRPAVEAGRFVLCDRFVDSSIAYQGGGRELGMESVGQINAFAIQEMIPDATVYLRMDSLEALNRRRSASNLDRLEIQPLEFYRRTQAAYDKLMQEHPGRFLAVDGSKPIDALADDILRAVMRRLEDAEGL